MSSNILITGATGTTGFELVELFANHDLSFKALIHDAGKKTKIKSEKAEIFIGDFDNIESLEKACEGVDKVFLVSPVSNELVKNETNFLKAALNKGVKHIVKLSAFGASENSEVSFLKSHAEIENKIKDSGIAYTFLRPDSFMENFLYHIQAIRTYYTFNSSLGKAKAGYVAAKDIAAVAFTVLTEAGHENKIYEITGPELVNFHDAAHILSDLLQTKVHYVEVPYEFEKQKMRENGLPEWLAEDLIRLNISKYENENNYLTNTVKDIGKKDPVTLREFFIEHQNSFSN